MKELKDLSPKSVGKKDKENEEDNYSDGKKTTGRMIKDGKIDTNLDTPVRDSLDSSKI